MNIREIKLIDYFAKNQDAVPFLDRLIKEWKKNEKIIIACDYDDTIKNWGLHLSCQRAIDVIREAQAVGAYLTIWTASDYTEREGSIRSYCEANGLRIDSINKNPIDLPFGHHGKIYANIFIDDRAGLNEALAILEYATILQSRYNEETNTGS